MFVLKSKRRDVWGERQHLTVAQDWSNLTEAERVRKAMQMLDIAEELVNRPTVIDATPVSTGNQILVGGYIYDPTDGDDLAEQERRRRRAEDLGEDQPEQRGKIGR